jgi:proteasome lid subunit RPN8/RPN11
MKNLQDFQEYVLSRYPQEACGLLINDTFYSTENVAEDPVNFFKFSEKASKRLARLQTPYCILHSHTAETFEHDPRAPSEEDMQCQKNSDVPWGIVHCDGENVTDILWFGPPSDSELEGRNYIPNVQDCFTIARDYIWQQRQLDIGTHPRPADWETWNPHYITMNYASLGFVEVSEPEEGDIVLFSIGSQYINHIGVYLGSGVFIHHLYNRCSAKDSLSKWKRQLIKTLRLPK